MKNENRGCFPVGRSCLAPIGGRFANDPPYSPKIMRPVPVRDDSQPERVRVFGLILATLLLSMPAVSFAENVKSGLWEVKWSSREADAAPSSTQFCLRDEHKVSRTQEGLSHFHNMLIPARICITDSYKQTGSKFTANVRCVRDPKPGPVTEYDTIVFKGEWLDENTVHGTDERKMVVDGKAVTRRQSFRGRWLRSNCDDRPAPATQIDTANKQWPRPDIATARFPADIANAKSAWLASERSRYEKLLAQSQAEILVVPFQVQEYGFHRSIRSLMTANLAVALTKSQKGRVADPYLVNRALGEGWRRIDHEHVYSLANKLRAKTIIWGYVGHDRNGSMALTLLIQKRDAHGFIDQGGKIEKRTFDQIKFTNERPPTESFQLHLPKIIGWLGFDSAAVKPATRKSTFDLSIFPDSPLSFIKGAPQPARDAYYFQILAALTPSSMERTRERLLEKSLLALSQMSSESPQYRALKARAYMGLGLRPAAIDLLRQPRSPEERALLAALNGNLPELQAIAENASSPIVKLFSKLDLTSMRDAFGIANRGKTREEQQSIASFGSHWQYLTQRAFFDWDQWTQYDNLEVKRLLDQDFPLPDFSLETILQGQVVLGKLEQLEMDFALSVTRHAHRLLDSRAKDWCCRSAIVTASDHDYADFLESIGVANLLRRADFLKSIQGSYRGALEFHSRLDALYKEHPAFLRLRAGTESYLSQSVDQSQKDALLKSSREIHSKVDFWEQTSLSDFPPRVNHIGWIGGYLEGYKDAKSLRVHNEKTVDLALKYATHNFRTVHDAMQQLGDPTRDEKLLKRLEGRFVGDPKREFLTAEYYAYRNDLDAAKKTYRSVIDANPAYWPAYERLGKMLVDDGNYTEATDLFAKYPEFTAEKPDQPVALSNRAYDAGSIFYWRGAIEQAVRFYKIAANLGTGSAASITSEVRLALLDSDFLTAARGSLDRARRYNSTYAYRDYIALLHLIGYSKEAWNAFPSVVQQYPQNAHIWEAALVGHQLETTKEPEIIAWAKQPQYRAASKGDLNFPARYLARAAVTDRVPSKVLIDAVAELEGEIIQLQHPSLTEPVRVPGQLPIRYAPVFKPAVKNVQRHFITDIYGATKKRVKSDLVYFLEAYAQLRKKNFAQASTTLREAIEIHDPFGGDAKYLLPYYAIATAKIGEIKKLTAVLDSRPGWSTFEFDLSRAAIAGLNGKTDESVSYLKKALGKRPFTEDRPVLVEYQYGEFVEWLYEFTKQKQYRDIAIDWAKVNQKIQPWYAWAYAMEARLTTNAADRQRALGALLFLDKNSDRLNDFTAKEKAAATKAFEADNPFRKLTDSTRQRTSM